MTNEEIINAFPECSRIKKADMAECVNRVFDEVKFYNEVGDFLMKHCETLWPQPTNWRIDRTDFDIWCNYFYGNYETKDFRFRDWRTSIEHEFVTRHGQHRTYDEACQVAADEWARMIFGRHIQDNGDKSSDGVFGNMLATIVKDRCRSCYGQDVIDRFREAIKQHYLGHCIYESKEHGSYRDIPDCDYHPSPSLRKALSDAGCKDDDISYMCPCKTCIIIDEVDNSVCVRGYQTARYM